MSIEIGATACPPGRPTPDGRSHRARNVAAAMVVLVVALSGSALSSAASKSFPGANGLIVFTRWNGADNDIWAADPAGGRSVALTRGGGHDQSPAVSADGKRIVFEGFRGAGSTAALFVMDADGTNIRAVTKAVSGYPVADTEPSWSPDGKRIVFSSNRPAAGTWHLWVVNSDGSGLRQLSTVSGGQPAWSPDGKRIVFGASDADVPESDFLALIDPDGRNLRRLLPPGTRLESSPGWSPDGRSIVFGRYASDWETTNHHNLYVVRADGSGERRLTKGVFYDEGASWSPDGKRIVFQRQRGKPPNPQLYTINADGTGLRPFITSPGWNFGADWSIAPRAESPRDRPTLKATVSPGGSISFTVDGAAVRTLSPGTHRLIVRDRSSTRGFILVAGATRTTVTTAAFVGNRASTVMLKRGIYSYVSRPQQPSTASNSFRVR